MPLKQRPATDAPPPEQLFLAIDEVATVLGVSSASVYRLIQRGELPSVYVGSLRRVSTAALQEFIDGLPTERGA